MQDTPTSAPELISSDSTIKTTKGKLRMISFLFPNPPIAPTWLRRLLCTAFLVILGTFAIASIFLLYHGLLVPLSHIHAGAGTCLGILTTAGLVNFALSRRTTDPEPGGWLYLAFLLMILLWWGTSLVHGGRFTVTTLFTESPTFKGQVWATALAATLVFRPRFGTVALSKNLGWWIASVCFFMFALLVMVADTDFQHFVALNPITSHQWIVWRIWDYILIVPFILLVIAVIYGMPTRYAAGGGLVVATFMFIFALLKGWIL